MDICREEFFMTQESLQIEPGLRWYAIQTKVNREKEVEKRLKDLRLEAFLPFMRARRRIGSRFHWVLAPLFPGYIFCRLDMVLSGKAARYSPGVKDFLTFGSRLAEVGEDIIQALHERCPDGVALIDPVQRNPATWCASMKDLSQDWKRSFNKSSRVVSALPCCLRYSAGKPASSCPAK